MLSHFSLLFRIGRLVLILLAAHALIAAPALTASTVAHADDDDDDWDDEEEEDEDEYEDEEGEEDEQPPVTAGGLYTKKTYPVTELERPLTITKGIFEVRAGIDIDVSADTAFDTWRAKVDARYGIQDNVELQAAFVTKLAGDPADVALLSAGIESAISYDLVDFRVLLEIPFTKVTVDDMGQPLAEATTEATADLAVGFPFRYKVKPELAIIALDKLMTIHLGGGDPDLTVGVGAIYQIKPNLAGLLRGEIFIPQFNTEIIQIPATAAIQFSPNNKIDIGGEFTLGDVKNDEDPFANRSLLLFAQARF